MALVLLVGASGCGDILWAPAPFTPVEVTLVYSPVEDLTRLTFRVVDNTSLTFEIADGKGGFAAIDWKGAPFPSGNWPCAMGTCYQLVQRGQTVPPGAGSLVRARHVSFGLFPGIAPTVAAPEMNPVVVTATPAADNLTMTVNVVDWLTQPTLKRKMQIGIWSEPMPSVDCKANIDTASEALGVQAIPGNTTAPLPAMLTQDGRYCVRVRTLPRDTVGAHKFATPLLLFPVTERREYDFTPPVETAPVVWRYVTDLQIPSVTCTNVQATVHASLAAALSAAAAVGGADSFELPTVDLSPLSHDPANPGCQQEPGRTLDGTGLADETKQYLANHYTNRYERPLFFYLNNFIGIPEQPLLDSLTVYRNSFGDPKWPAFMFAISTDAVQMAFGWDGMQNYAALDDMNFLPVLSVTLSKLLPFKTEIHDDNDILPLLDEPLRKASLGDLWKVCDSSPTVVKMQGVEQTNDLAPTVKDESPPGFRVKLPSKIFVPAPMFTGSKVIVRYELCKQYCNHPFINDAGASFPHWDSEPTCVRTLP